MSELEEIKQAMSAGEHTDGDLQWCVERITELEEYIEELEANLRADTG